MAGALTACATGAPDTCLGEIEGAGELMLHGFGLENVLAAADPNGAAPLSLRLHPPSVHARTASPEIIDRFKFGPYHCACIATGMIAPRICERLIESRRSSADLGIA